MPLLAGDDPGDNNSVNHSSVAAILRAMSGDESATRAMSASVHCS
jgi:hypothetical protein